MSRITPACAGSTCHPRCCTRRDRDHPRMRGEHVSSTNRNILDPGSPPHARGALDLTTVEGFLRGITPACAGSTASRSRFWLSARDHPRMRGEHTIHGRIKRGWPGSPPHARGAHAGHEGPPSSRRITPACAGSTPLPEGPKGE